jgi:hypothetical protein
VIVTGVEVLIGDLLGLRSRRPLEMGDGLSSMAQPATISEKNSFSQSEPVP